MKKLCAIGEALIDFIPQEKGVRLKDVVSFKRVAGGAPANVAATVCKLGGEAKLITALGDDPFGDYIMDCLNKSHIDTRDILKTNQFDTSLAFVALAADGNRDFKFYRRHAADLQYHPKNLRDDVLKDCGAIHFCSVDLVESLMKQTHLALIHKAMDDGLLVSFDPNLRKSLWNDDEGLRNTVLEFLPYANIIKIADEELSFITGYQNIEDALPSLFTHRCELLIYTRGKDGASLYVKDGRSFHVDGLHVNVVDTTGAGDSFIGAILYQLLALQPCSLLCIADEDYKQMLLFANAYGACTTTKQGALDALCDSTAFKMFLKSQQLEYLYE